MAIGSLVETDIKAPDGTYLDLYTVTVDSPTTLNIRLESTEFDAVLILFQRNALGEKNLGTWIDDYIDANDDLDDRASNAAITHTLDPGTYVIAVNSFEVEIGAYTLTTSTANLTLTGQYLQFRSYPNPAFSHFRAWVEFQRNGQNIEPTDLLEGRIFDPTGTELFPAGGAQFFAASYTSAVWNPATSLFEQIEPFGYSGLSFDLTPYADLPAGVYSIQVFPEVGAPIVANLDFPGKVDLPPVAPASMSYQWNPDGSLTLSWGEPAGTFDQYRVILGDTGGGEIFYGKALSGVSQVTLQPSLVQTITQAAGLNQGTAVNWSMQTRNYSGADNYARSISAPLEITWNV
jgi:hypothetical protein